MENPTENTAAESAPGKGSDSRATTDLDLPPAYRTQANMWAAMYWEARRELVNANRGIARLKRRVPVSPGNRIMAEAGRKSLATASGLSLPVMIFDAVALHMESTLMVWFAGVLAGLVLMLGVHGLALWVCFRQKNQNSQLQPPKVGC